jgi:hypothetical protein
VARLRRFGVPVLVLVMKDGEPGGSLEPGPMADQPARLKALTPDALAVELMDLAR